jgi:metallo-beta-lactamase class B
MAKKTDALWTALMLSGLLAYPVSAQTQASPQAAEQPAVQPQGQRPPAKPDSPETLAHIEQAKKIAGSVWPMEEKFLCENGHAANAADPGPVKLFDNLYAIPGTYGTGQGVIFIIPTSDGLLMIDSGWQKDVDSVLLPGLKTLGFDPVNIKLIVLTHGHPDHYGGATYLQKHYGTRVAMSSTDWDFVTKPQAPRPGFGSLEPPMKDMIAVEGQPITLGDESVMPVNLPGHTPGSLGLIFNVKDHGEAHVVAMVGGGFVAPPQPEQTKQFIQSLAHFEEWTKKMHADVELQNHPVMDGFGDKLVAVKARTAGQPNPFIVGQENYTKFLEVMSECAKVTLARHEEQ